MSKLITNTIRHTGGSADNITLDNSQNVTVEAKLTVANKDDDNVNVLEVKNDNGNVSGGFTQASDGDGQVFLKKNDSTNTVLFRSDGDSHITGGNVGIGTTSPGAFKLKVEGGDSDEGLFVHTGASSSQWLIRAEDNAANQRFIVKADGEVNIGNGDLIFGTAGKGIVLGSTSNTDANTLEDYEFGTWTPSFNAVSTGSLSTAYAKYVKVGHLVQVTFYVNCNSTSSNEFQMSMPFANNTSNGSWNVIPIQSNGSTVPVIGRIDENSTLMRVMTSWSSNSNGDSKQSYNDLNGEWIIGAGTYHTDA